MTAEINIAGRVIKEGKPPFIIAELSGNHQQSYEMAIKMIDAAAKAGVDAIKLQTYTADSMTLDIETDEFLIKEQSSLWKGQSLHSLYNRAATPYDWHKGLFEYARSLGLAAFSSPFDEQAVDFLESLDVPCYKIASFENVDLSLIRKVAKTGKPMIISTGMASLIELEEAVSTAREAGCNDLILLKCTSAYPSPAEDINLATMRDMSKRFLCPVGLSDHSLGIEVALAATALGAQVIEKHFVLNRKEGGVDAEFSLEPLELKQLVDQSKRISLAVGGVNYGDTKSDLEAKRYRRSIYIAKDIPSGTRIAAEHIRVVRPGLGLAPKFYDALLGKTASASLKKGMPTSWDLFS